MALSIIVIFNVIRSSQGRAMISIREDEVAAEAMGINTTKYKIMAFSIAAFFAGTAGALYAHFFMFLEPVTFGFLRSFEILTYVVLGGMGSISGSILASILLTALPEALRFLALYRMIIYAAALILLMLFRPQGLMGTSELNFSSFRRNRIFGNRGDKDAPAGSK
jgi:branched-chain amino acid transport system permease protein